MVLFYSLKKIIKQHRDADIDKCFLFTYRSIYSKGVLVCHTVDY